MHVHRRSQLVPFAVALRVLQHAWLALILGYITIACRAETLPSKMVCYDDVFEPFFMLDGDKWTGLNVDVLREAARRAGIAIDFKQMPFKRLELELVRGADSSVQCGFAFSRTEAREKYMVFGKVPMQPTEYTLFVRTEEHGVDRLEDLAGKVIGVRTGFRLPDAIAEGAKAGRWRLEDVGSDDINFKKLSLKRVDAVLANRDVGLYTLRSLRLSDIHPLQPLMRFDNFVVFSRQDSSEALALAFDRALESMNADGTMTRLRAAYFGDRKH